MKFTIITPCYNAEKYIGDNIKSVINNGYDNFEHIIVDDKSADESIERIMEFKDDRIKLIIHHHNLKQAIARNTAIKESTGDWIIPLDADDMMIPDAIHNRLARIKEYPDYECFYGYALKIKGNVSYEQAIQDMNKLDRHPSRLHSQGMCYKKTVFEKFGLYYDLPTKEDKELNYRLGIHDFSPFDKKIFSRRVHNNLAFYRRHSESTHKIRVADKKEDKTIVKLFNKRIEQLKKEGITKENTPQL